jgi:Piwi domain
MITSLKEMMVERLQAYKAKNNGQNPDGILVYRDGVSEGLLYFYLPYDAWAYLILNSFL